MPMYEYKCNGCGSVFQVMQKMGAGADGLSCPGCKGSKLTKLISATYSPSSDKAMPGSFESAMASMPKMGGGGCPSGTCGSGMCGM